MNAFSYRLRIVLMAITLATIPCWAQELDTAEKAEPSSDAVETPTKEESREANRMARMREFADSIKVYGDLEKTSLATLVEKPIFKWGNPQREAMGGVAYVWTYEGKPIATIGLWTYDDTPATDSYEVQSLSENPFATSYAAWTTNEPGAMFRPIRDASAPADSERRRLIQMRQLARKYFSATVYGEQKWEPLRLLPTPVYRYKETPPEIIDGAMFSFAQGTDPEVFLLLEARELRGKKTWHYAYGNQTSGSVRADFNGKQVWSNDESKPTFQAVVRRP